MQLINVYNSNGASKAIRVIIFGAISWIMLPGNSYAADEDCQVPLLDLILQQNYGLAYFCAGERLQYNPDDTEAQLYFARAAQEIGQYNIAENFAIRARSYPLSKQDRFASYLISGMARAAQGELFAAKLDLRRGSDFASTADELQMIRQMTSQIQSLSPWSFDLGFNIDPSTNINGGSMNGTMIWLGVPVTISEDGQAQSGIGYSINVSANYARQFSANTLWENTLSFDGTAYDGPGQNNINIGFETGIKYIPAWNTKSVLSATLGYQQSYIGAVIGGKPFGEYDPYYSQVDLGVEYLQRINGASYWTLFGKYSVRTSDVSAVRDVDIMRIGMSYGAPVFDGVAISLGGYYEEKDSLATDTASSIGNAYVGVNFEFANLPISLSSTLQYTHSQFEYRMFGFADARQDDAVSIDLVVTPHNIQWYGFNPTIGVSASQTSSNIGRYDMQEIRVYTGVSSSF